VRKLVPKGMTRWLSEVPCTVDSCARGLCRHTIGPNEGVTACPAGEYCTVLDGCTAAPACAIDEDCEEAFAGDPCKTAPRCDPASSICAFDLLDKDLDGHSPQVCGGGDCNDDDYLTYPGSFDSCDAYDNDCNGVVDDGDTESESTCSPLYECREGRCLCREENLCSDGCVDPQIDPANCGECGRRCPEGGACVNGACACSAGTVLCGNECVDVAGDPDNCGECGQQCDDGACLGGACATLRDLTSDAANFLALGDTVVAYSSGFDVRVVPKLGASQPLVVGTSGTGYEIKALAADQDHVYWMEIDWASDETDSGTLWRAPIDESDNAELIATGLCDSRNTGYFLRLTESSVLAYDNQCAALYTFPKSGGDLVEVSRETPGDIKGLALAEDGVFLSTYSGSSSPYYPYVLEHLDLESGSSTLLQQVGFADDTWTTPHDLVTCANDLIVLLEVAPASDPYRYVLAKMPATGGDFEILWEEADVILGNVGCDDQYAYWTSQTSANSYRIVRTPLAQWTAGTTSLVAELPYRPDQLQVDAAGIYWTNSSEGGVWAVLTQ
jgi:hypothetical protein